MKNKCPKCGGRLSFGLSNDKWVCTDCGLMSRDYYAGAKNEGIGEALDKAHKWLQENFLMYRGDNASDCMIAAFVAGMTSAIGSCPDCGAPLTFYHDTERTRAVCSKKCQGWKIVMELNREEEK